MKAMSIDANIGSRAKSLWLDEHPLILASKSAARSDLLRAAGLPHACVPADIDERALEAELPRTTGGEIARRLAIAKAETVASRNPGRLVLGADQTLSLGQERFTKPLDRTAADRQLCRLSGKTHVLHSALALVKNGRVVFDTVAEARMRMRSLSAAFVTRYLDAVGDAALSSVGGYQVEGLGIHLFEAIEGDQATILGLPLLPLLAFLRAFGSLADD